MISEFFIWCAGSDKTILSKCSDSERIKHIGFGTLVLVPAVLAFISMSYALSTIEGIQEIPNLSILGGIVWALIIFSLDRFIVSTHRRKVTDWNELRKASFYLRFLFAFILGVVVSHPLVLLYFEGSINDRIEGDVSNKKDIIYAEYEGYIAIKRGAKSQIDSLTNELVKKRDDQAQKLESEIDGEILKGNGGIVLTTGITGFGPSAKTKLSHLKELDIELQNRRSEDEIEKKKLDVEIAQLQTARDSLVLAYSESNDYLRQEIALESLKNEHAIVSITQWLLIIMFVLVDIMPFIFKTFAPFGMYDKILLDDTILFPQLSMDSRKSVLQSAYEEISAVYADKKDINKSPEDYRQKLEKLAVRYSFQSNLLIGAMLGFILVVIYFLFFREEYPLTQIYELVGISSITLSIVGNAIYEALKLSFKVVKK